MHQPLSQTRHAVTRVLLIEDNPDDACLLSEALNDASVAHIQLVHVESLEDAEKVIGQQVFQLILLDLSLPDSHGIETVIRVQREAPSVPIVVLTGLNDDDISVQAVRAGAQDYLVKGEIDGRILVRSIRYASERKQAYEGMARLAADLERANKAKDEFLNVMSHELHTPLSIVIGYSTMLREQQFGPLTEGQEQGIAVIQRNSKDLFAMIDSIMSAVKIESGSMIVEQDSISPVELLGELKLFMPYRQTKKYVSNGIFPIRCRCSELTHASFAKSSQTLLIMRSSLRMKVVS